MSNSAPAPNPSAGHSEPAAGPTLVLVDGHSLAFRAHHALARSRDGGLRTSTGIPTSVCHVFLKSLLQVIETEKPQYLAIAFDLGEPTFRHEADATYKADRTDTPADLLIELENLQELLSALNLQAVTAPGYEADDVLGTLAQRASEAGYRAKIVTGDRDLFQLVDAAKGISVLYLSQDTFGRSAKAIAREFGPEEVKEKLGVAPAQVVDYKALCGDASDNIPGVKGIGDKTAVSLLSVYGSLDGIYASTDNIKGAVKKKLEAGKADAYHSQHLARIVLDVPVEIELEDCKLKDFDEGALVPLLEKFEFKSFLSKIKQMHALFGGATEPASDPEPVPARAIAAAPAPLLEDRQLSLFDEPAAPAPAELPVPTVREPVPIKPRIIDTPEKLAELVQLLQTRTHSDTPVAWDTETTALEPRDAKLVGIGCCWGAGEEDVAYIPTGHTGGGNLDKAAVLEALRPILESADYPKALHNAKFDRLVLRCQGIELAGAVFDTMLASYVLLPKESDDRSEESYKLSDLAQRKLGIKAQSYESLKVPKGKTIADLKIPEVADYCGMDVYATFLLVGKLREELQAVERVHRLLLEVEQPLEPVLAEMEYTGIRINSPYLEELSDQLEKDLAKIVEAAYKAVGGEEFNLGSPKQVSKLLFEKLKLDTKKSRKTKMGYYSTDAAVLERLQGQHPVVDCMLEHRTLAKLKSTYADALPALVRADTGRVHTDFNQTATATGRLSSSNPNLQHIPIRTEFSRQIRKAFLPEPGWLLVSADYSQIELRILAHLSQEPVLVEAYRNNQDVHTVTAKLLFEKETVSAEERRFGKTINFGVIYGMGSARFARAIGKTPAEGKLFIQRFYRRYPKVFEYLQQLQREAIAQGYVETILGRRRYFTFEGESLRRLKGSNPEEIDLDRLKKLGPKDAEQLRAAANAPIQGSSADIIKVAMVRLQERLRNCGARMLLQVHDELVFEVMPAEWEELQPVIKSVMESAVLLSVPLVVDIRAGQNWMEAK
ncbi:DNA polymerase I [Kamptonema formosum]|uniref:DNA polymerase I n=1 Tax=Kamptonema formosum TaxID=331992 RepID=UPI00037EC904|nr:DNA polymerase I [Oscillatoria sp. PCC 10802]